MKKGKQLNITAIKSNIGHIHREFMDKVGFLPLQLDSQKFLILNMVQAKISAVLSCFREEKIVDKVETRSDNLDNVEYRLSKNEFCTSVIVATDGKNIVFTDDNFLIKFDYLGCNKETFVIDNIDNFDWDNFSIKLLEYIHKVMYNRADSLNASIFKD